MIKLHYIDIPKPEDFSDVQFLRIPLERLMILYYLESDQYFSPAEVARSAYPVGSDEYEAVRKSFGVHSRKHNLQGTYDNRDRKDSEPFRWEGRSWVSTLNNDHHCAVYKLMQLLKDLEKKDPGPYVLVGDKIWPEKAWLAHVAEAGKKSKLKKRTRKPATALEMTTRQVKRVVSTKIKKVNQEALDSAERELSISATGEVQQSTLPSDQEVALDEGPAPEMGPSSTDSTLEEQATQDPPEPQSANEAASTSDSAKEETEKTVPVLNQLRKMRSIALLFGCLALVFTFSFYFGKWQRGEHFRFLLILPVCKARILYID